MSTLRASAFLCAVSFSLVPVACRTSLGTPCAVGGADTCGNGAACVGDGPTGQCVRAYDTDAELWADAADNIGKTVLVRSLTLAPAPRMTCTGKYCIEKPADTGLATPAALPGETPRNDAFCKPCNACRAAVQPRNSNFRFMRSPGGKVLECTGDDCVVDCPPYLAGLYELVARVEPAGDSFGLSQVRLFRIRGSQRYLLTP